MNELILSLVNGVASGAVYGLMGLGLVIIYRATDVVNFALASMALMAIYLAAGFHDAGVPLALAFGIGVIACSAGGVVAREAVIRPLGPGRLFSALVVTMGLSLIVDDLTRQAWGSEPRTFPELVGGEIHIAGSAIEYQQVLTIAVAAVAMLAIAYLFKRTPLGSAMRAVAESSDTATLLGVRPQRIARVAWALGMGLAALGAGLIAPSVGLTVGGLAGTLFRAFAGIFLGGLRSMYGAVVGGVLVGILDNLAASYVSASFRDTVVFSVIIAVLLIRPEGLFGERSFARV
jgi:branched-chain amino acid transport system permease protein